MFRIATQQEMPWRWYWVTVLQMPQDLYTAPRLEVSLKPRRPAGFMRYLIRRQKLNILDIRLPKTRQYVEYIGCQIYASTWLRNTRWAAMWLKSNRHAVAKPPTEDGRKRPACRMVRRLQNKNA